MAPGDDSASPTVDVGDSVDLLDTARPLGAREPIATPSRSQSVTFRRGHEEGESADALGREADGLGGESATVADADKTPTARWMLSSTKILHGARLRKALNGAFCSSAEAKEHAEELDKHFSPLLDAAAAAAKTAATGIYPFGMLAQAVALTPAEKVVAFFMLIDTQGLGVVSVSDILKALLLAQGQTDRTLAHAVKMLTNMDSSGAGRVDRADFEAACKKDPELLASMAILLGSDARSSEEEDKQGMSSAKLLSGDALLEASRPLDHSKDSADAAGDEGAGAGESAATEAAPDSQFRLAGIKLFGAGLPEERKAKRRAEEAAAKKAGEAEAIRAKVDVAVEVGHDAANKLREARRELQAFKTRLDTFVRPKADR